MNRANTEKLFTDFPKIFKGRHLGPQQSLLFFGFECGDGWFDLIWTLCDFVQSKIDQNIKDRWRLRAINRAINVLRLTGDVKPLAKIYNCKEDTAWFVKEVELIQSTSEIPYRVLPEKINQVRALQVKEKFGTLRFYIGMASKDIQESVAFAEAFSSKICEVCGNKGKIRKGGWIKTLCDQHEAERHKDIEE